MKKSLFVVLGAIAGLLIGCEGKGTEFYPRPWRAGDVWSGNIQGMSFEATQDGVAKEVPFHGEYRAEVLDGRKVVFGKPPVEEEPSPSGGGGGSSSGGSTTVVTVGGGCDIDYNAVALPLNMNMVWESGGAFHGLELSVDHFECGGTEAIVAVNGTYYTVVQGTVLYHKDQSVQATVREVNAGEGTVTFDIYGCPCGKVMKSLEKLYEGGTGVGSTTAGWDVEVVSVLSDIVAVVKANGKTREVEEGGKYLFPGVVVEVYNIVFGDVDGSWVALGIYYCEPTQPSPPSGGGCGAGTRTLYVGGVASFRGCGDAWFDVQVLSIPAIDRAVLSVNGVEKPFFLGGVVAQDGCTTIMVNEIGAPLGEDPYVILSYTRCTPTSEPCSAFGFKLMEGGTKEFQAKGKTYSLNLFAVLWTFAAVVLNGENMTVVPKATYTLDEGVELEVVELNYAGLFSGNSSVTFSVKVCGEEEPVPEPEPEWYQFVVLRESFKITREDTGQTQKSTQDLLFEQDAKGARWFQGLVSWKGDVPYTFDGPLNLTYYNSPLRQFMAELSATERVGTTIVDAWGVGSSLQVSFKDGGTEFTGLPVLRVREYSQGRSQLATEMTQEVLVPDLGIPQSSYWNYKAGSGEAWLNVTITDYALLWGPSGPWDSTPGIKEELARARKKFVRN